MLCLDVELRRRNGNTFGACDLMAEVVRRFSMTSDEAIGQGVDYRDIRNTLKDCPGGSSMGPYLDRLVKHRTLPAISKALSYFRLKLTPHTSDKAENGWLGVTLKDTTGRVVITSYLAGSPLRQLTQVGDEVLALNGVRVQNTSHLQKLIQGALGQTLAMDFIHEGIVQHAEFDVPASPQHGVTLSGKGNERWRSWITTRQDP